MSSPESASSPNFTVDDLIQHVEIYGVDVFPPPDPEPDTIRAQAFFAELRSRYGHLYQKLTIGNGQFVITASVQQGVNRAFEGPTFAMSPRGPIFSFPLKVNEPIDLHGAVTADVFEFGLNVFLRCFPSPPARKVLRVGLVRRLIFGTGKTDCSRWIGKNMLDFGEANLTGVQAVFAYVEEQHNVQIQMQTVQLAEQAVIPGMAGLVNMQSQHGLTMMVDVNNREMREQTAEDRAGVIARANQLWPQRLLAFLNQRRLP